MRRQNPITPQILGRYREGSSGYRILAILFDKYWDEISDFAREHRLAMPTHYLGQGETGIALRAGRRKVVCKLHTANLVVPVRD